MEVSDIRVPVFGHVRYHSAIQIGSKTLILFSFLSAAYLVAQFSSSKGTTGDYSAQRAPSLTCSIYLSL